MGNIDIIRKLKDLKHLEKKKSKDLKEIKSDLKNIIHLSEDQRNKIEEIMGDLVKESRKLMIALKQFYNDNRTEKAKKEFEEKYERFLSVWEGFSEGVEYLESNSRIGEREIYSAIKNDVKSIGINGFKELKGILMNNYTNSNDAIFQFKKEFKNLYLTIYKKFAKEVNVDQELNKRLDSAVNY